MSKADIDARFVERMRQGSVVAAPSAREVACALFRLRATGFRLLHVHSRKAAWCCVLARALGFRVIRTQHFGTLTNEARRLHGVLATARNLLTLRTWWVDQWVAISETSKSYLQSRWSVPKHRIAVIHNGIDLARFAPATKGEREALRKKLGWQADWTVLISVGALVARKRHAQVIDAFAGITKDRPNARLFIVGGGSERDRLDRLIADLGLNDRVRLLGLRHDVPDLLAASDICVHAALDEAFGLVVAEGMACGNPAVVLGGKGPAEIVEDGKTGVVVARDAPSGMARAMADLIDDPALRTAYGRAARDAAARRFSLTAMRDAYLALYESWLPNGRLVTNI